jgi:TPR repeat protein
LNTIVSPPQDHVQSLLRLLDSGKYSECLEEFRKLALEDDVGAAMALAQIYLKGGDGIAIDVVEAKRWLEHVVMQIPLPRAYHELGILHFGGLGVPRDVKLGLRYFRKAALKGFKKSIYAVGLIYSDRREIEGRARSGRILLRSSLSFRELSIRMRLLAIVRILVSFAVSTSPRL